VTGEQRGIVYSRSGRRFFDDERLEGQLLDRINRAMDKSGLWRALETDWVVLDCELMPWSVKAQELLREQYAAVGKAGSTGVASALKALQAGAIRLPELSSLAETFESRLKAIEAYSKAYGHYCWPVASIDDLRLAPFHMLASENAVHADRPHTWHMELFHQLAAADPALLVATAFKIITLGDDESEAAGVAWWEELTGRGGEGMVVKPIDFTPRQRDRLIQPAIKIRGPEYLRIIYGPEYSLPQNLERLRSRALNAKRSLALREFALGIEGLERFVRREPLRKVHECAFAVLAMESEPVDPRL
jgi:protein phosphatase